MTGDEQFLSQARSVQSLVDLSAVANDEHFEFGPLSIVLLDTAATVAWIVAAAESRRRSVVVTSNIHHLRLAESDPEFRAVVSAADLNVADGWPLVMASRILRGPSLPERVAGVTVVERVLQRAEGLRIAILGGPPGAATRLAERLAGHHDVVLVDELEKGHWESEQELAALAASIARLSPNLTLLGIGAPKQELLAFRLRDVVDGPILCCGAAIEILAGIRPRAPRAAQVIGLEWAFRMLLEPRRLGPRYARSGRTFTRLLFSELTRRRA